MSKKLYFLISFVVVVYLGSLAQAVPIEVNNFSFEYDADGNQIYCHAGINPEGDWPGVMGWKVAGTAYAGVDPYCLGDVNYDPCAIPANICFSEQCYTNDHSGCHCWPATHGIVYCYLQATKATMPTYLYQNMDGNDPNAVITVGRKYILTWDAMSEIYAGALETAYSVASFYYGGEPTADGNVVATTSYQLPVWIGDLNEWEHEWVPNLTLTWVATPDHPAIGKTLGLRWFSPSPGGAVRAYTTTENVRLQWSWATQAFNPSPADGATDVPRDVNLSWSPGLWASDTNAHHVYFGTSWPDVNSRDPSVYFGLQGPNSFDPTPGGGQLALGATYYWAIDEVNENYVPIPGVPNPPWLGDIWSFRVTGLATNPSPEDGAKNVSVYTKISWTPGTDSDKHDVYFGADQAAVTDANIDVNFGVYMDRQDSNSFDAFVPPLQLNGTYYWRIDEVNEAGGTLIKGNVWTFQVGGYIPLEDFDSYATDEELGDVWNDAYTTGINALVYLENGSVDANLVRDGNSMRYEYYDGSSPYYSEAYANTVDLGATSDWTANGVEALVLYFLGKAGNDANERMYVALTDGDNPKRTAKVIYDDSNELSQGWKGYQEWNIDLQEFVDDNNVNLANIWRITIGFGDGTNPSPASGEGIVYFDEIGLYPARCVPEKVAGSFNWDCTAELADLDIIARDWLMSGPGNITAAAPSNTNLVGYWMMDDNVSTGQLNLKVVNSFVNANHGVLFDDNKIPGRSTHDHHTTGKIGTGALTFDGFDDYIEIPALNLNSNTVTISAWIKRNGKQTMYAGIVACHYDPNDPCDPCAPGTGAGLDFGSGGTYGFQQWAPWEINHELCYFWSADMTGWPEEWTWDWHTSLIVPDNKWVFVALVVEPTKATVYMYDGELRAATNYTTHYPELFNGPTHIGDQMQFPDRMFKGAIDDVHIYKRSLSPSEILYLALVGPGSQYLELEPWRADADGDDKVDFKDFAIMADNWLDEVLWPF